MILGSLVSDVLDLRYSNKLEILDFKLERQANASLSILLDYGTGIPPTGIETVLVALEPVQDTVAV